MQKTNNNQHNQKLKTKIETGTTKIRVDPGCSRRVRISSPQVSPVVTFRGNGQSSLNVTIYRIL